MNYIELMRPKHYIKNLLIFIPLIFSGQALNVDNILLTLGALIVFSLTTSIVYILNDIKDREKDKKHPTKKNRPIASGRVSIENAVVEAIILAIVNSILLIILRMPIMSIILLLIYFILNLGYSLGAKQIPLLDIVILVSGFFIRVLYGASILNIKISNWLYLSIITISFYLSLGKRRNEIEENGAKSRNVLKYYTKGFLDKNMYMFLSMAIIFYSLWTMDNKADNNFLILTVPLVMIICMRYSMNIEGSSDGDPVEVILKDKVLMILGLTLAILIFLILYVV